MLLVMLLIATVTIVFVQIGLPCGCALNGVYNVCVCVCVCVCFCSSKTIAQFHWFSTRGPLIYEKTCTCYGVKKPIANEYLLTAAMSCTIAATLSTIFR